MTRRDLLEEECGDPGDLWQSREAARILHKQGPDGSWGYPGRKPGVAIGEDYSLLETYRNLGQLVEMFGFNRKHPSICRVAEYLCSCQTSDGDFRGIYGRQPSPNYSAAILELLVKAGYASAPSIERCFRWLLFTRQDDGGWALPARTVGTGFRVAAQARFIEADRSKPFSHLITGVVLRAFAAHPNFRGSDAARHAGNLLVSRLFQSDRYPDRRDASYWERVSFPFWYTDIVSALDSLSRLGLSAGDPRICGGLEWLARQQLPDGTFSLYILRNKSAEDLPLWVTLAAARVFRRFFDR